MEFTPIVHDSPAHPLFSTIITLYILSLLYSPSILFSPLLPITAALLLTLLRSGAGASNPSQPPNPDKKDDRSHSTQAGNDRSPANNTFEESFVEWNVKAPLSVIYEDDEDSNQNSEDVDPAGKTREEVQFARYPSLSMCFPETDSDSGSSTDGDFEVIGDWISDHDLSFGWCDSDPNQDGDGLIEIALEESYGGAAQKKGDGLEEEDNLIEIDIFEAGSREILAGKLGDPR